MLLKTRQQVRKKTEYQSSVSLPYIHGSASHKIERILKEAGFELYHTIENRLFRSLCTRKNSVNEFQKPGVYRIPCECGLLNFRNPVCTAFHVNERFRPVSPIYETGRNLSLRLKEHKTNCEKAELEKISSG